MDGRCGGDCTPGRRMHLGGARLHRADRGAEHHRVRIGQRNPVGPHHLAAGGEVPAARDAGARPCSGGKVAGRARRSREPLQAGPGRRDYGARRHRRGPDRRLGLDRCRRYGRRRAAGGAAYRVRHRQHHQDLHRGRGAPACRTAQDRPGQAAVDVRQAPADREQVQRAAVPGDAVRRTGLPAGRLCGGGQDLPGRAITTLDAGRGVDALLGRGSTHTATPDTCCSACSSRRSPPSRWPPCCAAT